MKKFVKKSFFLFAIFFTLIAFSTPVFAQNHISIPLTDQVYQILEYAFLQGYIQMLPGEKPYSQHFVIAKLDEIINNENIKDEERAIFEQTKERIKPKEKLAWYELGAYTNRYNDDVKLPVQAGMSCFTSFAINANNPIPSLDLQIDAYFMGDITDYISYKIDGGGILMKYSLSAYAPYEFDKTWDGWQSTLGAWYEYEAISERLAGGLVLDPELSFAAFDDKVSVKVSRTKRDFGYGSSSLVISKDAQPFLAMETHLNPVSWFETNFIVGTLEYESAGDLKKAAANFQNMYSLITGQFNITDYFYFGALSSGVWMKRLELGYMYPFLLPFSYQNQIGDFDNVQMGFYFGSRIPKITHLYFSLFCDEWNLTSKPFLHLDRNMYTFQVGAKTPVPIWLSSLTTQYTKIEPYMYTHPLTENPWYDQAMDTTYVNHGECIGYYLPPNSDEFLISFESTPLWFLHTNIGYKLVRHGATSGSGKVDGSSLYDSLDYSQPLEGIDSTSVYWKNFLHDGVYEWINYVTLAASLNCRKWNVPIIVNFAYTFSYTTHSYDNDGKLAFFSDDEYSNVSGNYFSVSVKVW